MFAYPFPPATDFSQTAHCSSPLSLIAFSLLMGVLLFRFVWLLGLARIDFLRHEVHSAFRAIAGLILNDLRMHRTRVTLRPLMRSRFLATERASDRTRRILVVARVFVAGDALAHLDYGEHAAHADRAELAFAAHHWQRVRRAGHVHVQHLVHAVRAHLHVTVHELADFL